MGSRKRVPKIRNFVKTCIEKGILSPSKMRDLYNEKYPRKVKGVLKSKTADAFRKAIRRSGISAEKRLELKHEAQKSKELRDIEEYEEVQRYLDHSRYSTAPIGEAQIDKTLKDLRTLWNLMSEMGYPNPRDWTEKTLGKCMEKHFGKDKEGWKHKNKILRYYGAFNRCFQGILPKGYSTGLKRPAGELKDFFEFEELAEFLNNVTDTLQMSREGWDALYTAQVNTGAREGTKLNTGILSLCWEQIDYNSRRCKIRDKGIEGKPARLWTGVPLDLFVWINGWEALMKWHEQRYGYRATQTKHAVGRCFPVNYNQYRAQFHKTRHRCNSRISQDLETLIPHILRKTHAQYCKRIGVSLENTCGDTKSGEVCEGRYGVGWKDPKVPLGYYLTKEAWEYAEQDQKIEERMKDRVLPQLESVGLFSSLCIPIPQVPSTRKVSARSHARKNRSNCQVRPSFSLAIERTSFCVSSLGKNLSGNIHSQDNMRTISAK